MSIKRKLLAGIAAGAAGLLALSGCASGGNGGGSGDAGGDGGDGAVSVGFFGFAASNSFAQGVYAGVEEAAQEMGATATFVDGQFDGQLQAQQINDAVTAGTYDVIIIQANDNLVVQPPLEKAIEAGITVVVEFTAVGPDFATIEPQVDGAISIVDPAVGNGEALAELGLMACEDAGKSGSDCKVAYMEGSPALPLDNARTDAVVKGLEAGGVTVLPSVTGGYTADEGRSAFQNITQANPDVDVVIGSSQAIAGAFLVAGEDSGIKFVGNGSSRPAVENVLNGNWYAVYALDVIRNGRTAVELGIKHFQGEEVEMATDERSLAPAGAIGTAENLEGFEAGYDE